jgi:AraC-like DNA-binding protein
MMQFDQSGTAIAHADQVYSIANGDATAPQADEVSASWKRCLENHGVDPTTAEPPRILTSYELKHLRSPLEALIVNSQEELDRLYSVVHQAGYVVLLCNADGVAIEHRGQETLASEFQYWGTWLGGVWSEAIEGTNGIGTCIAEKRSITIHQNQHFRTRHISLSCSGAPIFGVDGGLLAVLDVSCIDPELSEHSHALTGSLTVASARAIEERLFRDQFRQEWIVAVAPPDDAIDSAMLLAVDRDQRIVGVDRHARATLSFENQPLQGNVSLWAIYERHLTPFRRKDGMDIPTQLVLNGTAEVSHALITPPESTSGAWRNPAMAGLHTRPRLGLLGSVRPEPPSLARGGLPPQVLRRVREYVDTHVHRNIDLETLASNAQLSVYHFARAFKQSTGVTPHGYLLQRRVERAQELLVRTDLPLSEIALETGFADHSHFARKFRRLTGISPSEARRSRR